MSVIQNILFLQYLPTYVERYIFSFQFVADIIQHDTRIYSTVCNFEL